MPATEVNRLNSLAAINSAKRYLEIGVCEGRTFFEVNVRSKVGVDPHFLFDYRARSDENTLFYDMTSDMFWSTACPAGLTFDIIYIDGLHRFEQALRDFVSSQGCAHDNTIWLIDDTCPTDFLASLPDFHVARKCRNMLRSRETFWMGDVYKLVFFIHDFLPQLSYATFSGHGQTVVWKQRRSGFVPTWNRLERISGMWYLDFLKYRNSHFHFMNDSDIYRTLDSRFRDRENRDGPVPLRAD